MLDARERAREFGGPRDGFDEGSRDRWLGAELSEPELILSFVAEHPRENLSDGSGVVDKRIGQFGGEGELFDDVREWPLKDVRQRGEETGREGNRCVRVVA